MNGIRLPFSVTLIVCCACGGEPATPAKQDFDSDTRSPFRYEFFDAVAECGTGLQTFESLGALCIHIQDPVRNNDCAEAKRRSHFDSHCQDSGYAWHESFSCDVRLVGEDTPIEFLFSETQVRSRTRACSGYTLDAPDSALEESTRSVQVSDRARLNVETRFAPRAQDPSRAGTDITLTLRDVGAEEPLIGPLVLKPATVGGYWHVPVEGAYLLYECHETWACVDGAD